LAIGGSKSDCYNFTFIKAPKAPVSFFVHTEPIHLQYAKTTNAALRSNPT
jgi:hypothetical protein